MIHVTQNEAALWYCESCSVWWCSQSKGEATDFMKTLPIDVLEEMGWDNFRGWGLGGTPRVTICPDCYTSSQSPRFGSASAHPPLTIS